MEAEDKLNVAAIEETEEANTHRLARENRKKYNDYNDWKKNPGDREQGHIIDQISREARKSDACHRFNLELVNADNIAGYPYSDMNLWRRAPIR
jgi:hypothetical protein